MTNQYEEGQFEEEVAETGVKKFLPTIVMVGAISVFSILAWYAYNSGTPVKEEDLLVVEADKTPMKEKPADPGGMKFPNQDKTIFETFSNSPQEDAKVERVLPAPEEPIKQVAPSETKIFVDEKRIQYADEKKSDTASSIIVSEEKTADEKPVEVKKIEAVGVEEKKPLKTAETKTVENPAKSIAKPVVKTLPKGAKIQLGAYPSEAEARKDWARIQKKFTPLAGKSPIIAKATVNGKDFYRLRVATGDAAKTCSELSAKGQACLIPKN